MVPCGLALAKLQYSFIFSLVGIWQLQKIPLVELYLHYDFATYFWESISVISVHVFMNVNIRMKSHRDSILFIYYWELLKIKIWFPMCVKMHNKPFHNRIFEYNHKVTQVVLSKMSYRDLQCSAFWILNTVFFSSFFFLPEIKHRLAHMVVWSQIEMITNKCSF